MELGLLIAIAVGAPTAPLTVADVTSKLQQLHGKEVVVRGWLDQCKPLSCGLFASRHEASQHRYGKHMLPIGSTEKFDSQALGRGPVEVILRATVSANCRRSNVICLDRADILRPISVTFLENE